MRDKDDSPILYKPKKHIEIAYTNIDNNESKLEKNISDFDLNSEYFNINKDDTFDKNINENLLFSSVGSEEKDQFNYYNVKKANIVNYMTMLKFNNDTCQRQKSNLKIKKNKTKIETAKGDIISISNSIDNDKKIMISELDIELSNGSKNNDNFLTENKEDEYNYTNTKNKNQKDFKKEIEQNLRKFLKSNLENKTNNDTKKNNRRNKLSIKKRLKKHFENINYCFTETKQKSYIYKKNSLSNKSYINYVKKKPNEFKSFISKKKKIKIINTFKTLVPKFKNNSFKTRKQNKTKYNLDKKFHDLIKINLAKNFNKNNKSKQKEFKSKIFNLQNKRLEKNKITKPMELTEYIAKNHNYYIVNNNTVNDKNSIKNDYFTINGSRRVIDQQDKKYYSSELRHNDLNLNKKNIIIQNFNCIDYNNINININNNNVIKSHNLYHKRDAEKINISNNITNKAYTLKNTDNFWKKEKTNKINFLNNIYIKKFFSGKNNKFQRKNHNKKLIFRNDNTDIKSRIFNCYLTVSRGENSKEKNNNKIKNNLIIKSNVIEFKKYFNNISTTSAQKAFKNYKRSNLLKL